MPRALATEHGMLLLGGHPPLGAAGMSESGGLYDLCADAWTPIGTAPFRVDTLQTNYTPIVAWTGDEVLVWGGYEMTPTWTGYAEGMGIAIASRLDAASGSWSGMNRSGEPRVRESAAQVWTGDRLLIWGGVAQSGDATWVNHDDGALYDPATDSWTAIASDGAPSGRGFVEPPVWTGEKLIVWGGYRYEGGSGVSPKASYPTDGAIYDPATDSWTPMAPLDAQIYSMVWTGEKMIAIGQLDGRSTPGTVEFVGAVFDPAANSWSAMRAPDVSMVADVISAGRRLFWSGKELLLFAERIEAGRGIAVLLRYDPDADAWSKTDVPASPAFAYWQSVQIAGDKVVISGPGPRSSDARGAPHESTQIMTFDATTSKWSTLPVLQNRALPIVVISAGQLLVWGGADIYPDLDKPLTCGPPMGACDPITPMITKPLGDGVRIGL